MAEKLTIARPYAQAIFELANENATLEIWKQILQLWSEVVQTPEVAILLDNPLVGKEKLLKLFEALSEKAFAKLPREQHQEIQNFLQVLIKEKRLSILPDILNRFQSLMAAQRDLKEVIVISAFPLDNPKRENIKNSLIKYLKSQVAVEFREDQSLIGGVIFRCGNWVMDGSIKGKLQRLRDNL